MLKLKLELYPYGEEKGKKVIAEMEIWNKSIRGNPCTYGVIIKEEGWKDNPRKEAEFEIHDWDRHRPAMALVSHALDVYYDA